jgi:trigger factor
VGEEKEIKVTFPENYGAKEIAGKEAKFKVILKKIQEKKVPEIDDELAKKLLQKDDADVEVLKDEIKKELLNVKKTELFTPKKAELAELLVEKIEFDLPDVIVDKETELTINQKAQSLTADEIKEISENEEKLKEFQEEAKKEAEKKVKLTFIIDELAKVENISVSDEEVLQLIYFDAIRNGQDAEQIFNYYKDNNLLPAVKMSILEDRVLTTLLDKKAK